MGGWLAILWLAGGEQSIEKINENSQKQFIMNGMVNEWKYSIAHIPSEAQLSTEWNIEAHILEISGLFIRFSFQFK